MTGPATEVREAVGRSPDGDRPTAADEGDTAAPRRRRATPEGRIVGVGVAWLRVVAVTIAAAFLVAWAGLATLGGLTERETAIELWELGLRPPTELSIALAMIEHERDGGRYLTSDQDLVGFVLTPEEIQADLPAVIERIVVTRAAQLYDGGPPADPGAARRSFTGVPRVLLTQLTAERHEQVPVATMAAMVGVGAGILVALVSGGIAAGLWLTGVASLVAWGVVAGQVRLLQVLVETSSPVGGRFADALATASSEPIELLLFVGIALVAAGGIYRWLVRSS
jgi:hypothetical protein